MINYQFCLKQYKIIEVCTNKLDEIHIEFLFGKFKGYLEKLKNVTDILNWINVTVEQKIPLSDNIRQNLRESLRKMIDNGMDKKDGVLQTRDHHTALKLINQLESQPGQYNTQQKSFSQIPSSNNINTLPSNPQINTQSNYQFSQNLTSPVNNIPSLNSVKNNDFQREELNAPYSFQSNELAAQSLKDNQYNKVNPSIQNYSTVSQQAPVSQQLPPSQSAINYQNTFPSSTTSNQQQNTYQFTNPEVKRTLDFGGSSNVYENSVQVNNYLDKPASQIGQYSVQTNNLDYLSTLNKNPLASISSTSSVPNNNNNNNQFAGSAAASSSLGFGNIPGTTSNTQYNTNFYSSNLLNQPANKINEPIHTAQPYTYDPNRQYY